LPKSENKKYDMMITKTINIVFIAVFAIKAITIYDYWYAIIKVATF